MKKISIFIGSILIATNLSFTALAEENSISLKDAAGITPDSILYPIDTAIDSLKLSFTFSNTKKVKVLSDIAKERLGESEQMAEEGKTKLAQQALEEYNNYINDSVDKLTELMEENYEDIKEENTSQNINSDDLKNNDETIDKELEELQEEIQDTQNTTGEVLGSIKEDLEDNVDSKEVLEKVIEMQKAKKEAVTAMVEKRHELNTARKNLNIAKRELKKIQKSGTEEALKKAQELLDEQLTIFTQAKEEFKAAFETKKEVMKGGIKQNNSLEPKKIEKDIKEEPKFTVNEKTESDNELKINTKNDSISNKKSETEENLIDTKNKLKEVNHKNEKTEQKKQNIINKSEEAKQKIKKNEKNKKINEQKNENTKNKIKENTIKKKTGNNKK
ncbi:DUF5667 domain-containing protein [Haloimpatiens sp. FM7330]|uniref:DUF5667 domain-containing protein n=1 Tax=Haloimpatiens sp. FM7330 TaxID=3298610 RepID=UPI0036430466